MTDRERQPHHLSAADARRVIREIAADGGKIVLLPHAIKRLVQRKVTDAQVRSVIRTGAVVGPPGLDESGLWRVEMQGSAAGDLLTVVVAIEWQTRLLVVTLYADESRRRGRR